MKVKLLKRLRKEARKNIRCSYRNASYYVGNSIISPYFETIDDLQKAVKYERNQYIKKYVIRKRAQLDEEKMLAIAEQFNSL